MVSSTLQFLQFWPNFYCQWTMMLCMNSADELTSPDLVLLFTVVTCSLSCPQALNCSVSALRLYCILWLRSSKKKKNENEKIDIIFVLIMLPSSGWIYSSVHANNTSLGYIAIMSNTTGQGHWGVQLFLELSKRQI